MSNIFSKILDRDVEKFKNAFNSIKELVKGMFNYIKAQKKVTFKNILKFIAGLFISFLLIFFFFISLVVYLTIALIIVILIVIYSAIVGLLMLPMKIIDLFKSKKDSNKKA